MQQVFGHSSDYLVAQDAGGRLRGVLPLVRLRSVLFGDFMVSMPFFNYGGAVGDSAEVELALMEHAAELAHARGVGHIEFRDDRERPGLRWPVRTDKVSMLLELPGDVDELWKRLGSKLRAQIKRPTKEGATTTSGGLELLDDFYRVFSRNMRDLGTPVYGPRLFRTVLAAFPEEATLFRVEVGGEPAASALVLFDRERAEIPWASSLRRFNRLGVNMLLYWEVLRACVERGVRVFDFGRSTVDAGTYRFKRQWGAEPHQLHWHYWLPPGAELPQLTPSNPRYQLAIAVWKRLPIAVANLVGPSVVKYLP